MKTHNMRIISQILAVVCLLSLVCLQNTAAAGNKCYAIAFQDGGDFAAYEAGVFQGLVQNLAAADRAYDVVTGVSFGGVNAAVLDQFEKGQEIQAADKMVELWRNLDHTDVYRNYVGGLTQAFLYERSLYTTIPWRLFLQQHFLGAHKRLIDIGATDIDSAAYIRYDESLTGADWIDALMASTAEPVLFPYQIFEGRSLFSGSVSFSLDLSSAIQRCRTLVQNDADIVVDTILTAKKDLGPWTGREKSIESLLRAAKMLQYVRAYRDYTEAREAYPQVQFRYTVAPSQVLPNPGYPFAFKQADLNKMVDLGLADAKAAVQAGPAGGNAIMREYYRNLLRDNLQISDTDDLDFTDAQIDSYRATLRKHIAEYRREKASAELVVDI